MAYCKHCDASRGYIPAHRKQSHELYNLAEDIFEQDNLVEQYPEKVKELSDLLDKQKQK
ncbi:hypothetical protein [Sphingobacterium yanglingense]|uniref:hypothetical protein n=1 Tax=Sphingobacterium yanglingense TaxID=1437280 RepID=UPI0013C2FFB2|nr:hypothetical protein [Sphingobacterium yanglingense]